MTPTHAKAQYRKWFVCPTGKEIDSAMIMQLLRAGQAILITPADLERQMAELKERFEPLRQALEVPNAR